jgi:transposase
MSSTLRKPFFLIRKVLAHYPSGKIIIVLDNARIHHAKLLQPLLEEIKGRLELVFLPPHSPKLNIAKGLWKWLKSDVINNELYYTFAEIPKKCSKVYLIIPLAQKALHVRTSV